MSLTGLSSCLVRDIALLTNSCSDCKVVNCTFTGNYQDHLHLPTSKSTVMGTTAVEATRLGYVVIQETNESLSTENVLQSSIIQNSGSDGVQIQGDSNKVLDTEVSGNGGYGIHLCLGNGTCVPPGGDAVAMDNQVDTAKVKDNALGDTLGVGENGNAAIMDMMTSSATVVGRISLTIASILATSVIVFAE